MPAALAPWTSDGLHVSGRCGGLEVKLDLGRAAAGLAVSGGGRTAVVDHLLGLDLGAACPPSDQWVRGSDVTAVYEPHDARRLRATAMWRQHACGVAVAAWELIASAQTSLLDSDPAASVVADITADQVRWLMAAAPARWSATVRPARGAEVAAVAGPPDAAALLAARPTGEAVLVAAHPDDASRLLASWDRGRLRLACRLFTRQLEKGVLLRSRVLAACGPAADTAWAEQLVADFHASPPPLST